MSVNALWTSTAGLKATQAAIGIVSQNVANAGTAGYVRRTLDTVSTGVANSSVSVGTVTRSFDAAALRQLRQETAGAAYTAAKSDVAGQLDKLYGTPGTATSLDGAVNTFTESLQEMSVNATSAAARTTVLGNAAALASRINNAAASVQDLRSGLEAQLGSDTADASGLLKNIAALNGKIQSTTDDASRADLQDQRDQAINSLSSYFGVQTVDQRDGTVSVLTSSGITLVDRGNAASLSFDGRGSLNANSAYSSDPTQRTVGTITATTPSGATIDLGAPGALRSGSIAAQIELRDSVLPQAQRQLDDLAAGLASALTDKSVAGTLSGNSVSVDLQGIQAGNTLTVPVTTPDGKTHNLILVAANSANVPISPNQTDDATAYVHAFDISGGSSTYGTALGAALSDMFAKLGYPAGSAPVSASPGGNPVTLTGNATAAVSTSGLTMPAGTTTVLGATARVTLPTSASDLTGAYPQIPLFVDGSGNTLFTGAFDSGSQRTGLAQRLAVNSALTANSSALVVSSATDSTASGARAQFVFSALTATQQTFSSSSGIGGVSAPYSATVAGFAQDVIAAQGSAATSAATLNDTQSVALSTAQSRFSASAGVNIDEEMSNLIALQTAYSANARVLTAARDMLNQLLQI